ncbi:MAG TPA: DUF4148 domain-containing protein [Anaeromyxobacteraceae bacterium]|nr:DUF4148 domain-containing protein [Anaeromyxobacteraceae bacterium]
MKKLLFVIALAASALPPWTLGADSSSPPPEAALSPKTRAVANELKVAKGSLMAAVGACNRPDTCDPTAKNHDREATRLLLQAEDRFMSLCETCATRDLCEEERAKMRDGKRSRGVAPCR